MNFFLSFFIVFIAQKLYASLLLNYKSCIALMIMHLRMKNIVP